ncbi:MAG TPA: S-layer homology domain-containing protein [Acidimicrobiia bacterium]|nr:S-layer homology domain-containing protein [Acidimicrobiia bacterium]
MRRRSLNRALAALTTMALLVSTSTASAAGERFDDVGPGHTFAGEIDWLAEQGITRGCNPPDNNRFCPDDPVTRGQMAAFLGRALGLTDPGDTEFIDDDTSVFEGDIERLAAAGITRGCNPPENNRFCPDDPVTRGQMAAFLHRALPDLELGDPTEFVDDDGSVFEDDIEWLAATGVTRGCNPPENNRFCPDDPVTRGQMGAFLYRAIADGGVSPEPEPEPEPDPDPDPDPEPEYDSPELISVRLSGLPSKQSSLNPSVTADGRYVAFTSWLDDLVPNDTNEWSDTFVRDRLTGTTERVSVASDGEEGDWWSDDQLGAPGISDDGRYVVFVSHATNLVDGDTNGHPDIFLHDRTTKMTTRVSVDSEGNQANGISRDPAISGNGRYVVYSSSASNLVPGDTNDRMDVFRYDRVTGTTTRVSLAHNGTQLTSNASDPDISADGTKVTFASVASNVVLGDTNGQNDVFVRDITSGTNTLVSISEGGTQGNNNSYLPAISADGTHVAFLSPGRFGPGVDDNLIQIWLKNLATKELSLVSVAPDGVTRGTENSWGPSVSNGGKYVGFSSSAPNLVSDDTNEAADVFVRDMETGVTKRVSLTWEGLESPRYDITHTTDITPDGRWVVFASGLELVPGDDPQGWPDIFAVAVE